ncbi:MAG: hypothetical protein ACRDYD_07090 [Acidimicrobiales bacterium]
MADQKAQQVPTNRLDARERLAGFAGAALVIAIALVLWIPALASHPVLHGRSTFTTTPAIAIVIGFVAAGLLVAATLYGRRVALGIVALLVGEFGPWGNELLIGFPFLALAFWQLMKFSRVSRQRVEARRRANPSTRPAGRGFGRRARQAEIGPRRPAASKRYTPPKASQR